MINRLLYLGPIGSYSEIAKDKFVDFYTSDCEFEPVESIYKIIRLLKDADSQSIAAVIPVENSIEGVVRETQDNLVSLAQIGFRIQAETFLPIEHSLISYGDKSQIKVISSHPQALAQCRDFIFKNWGDDIKLEPVLSTSSAVEALSADKADVAAIANQHCANIYNVPVLETKINDEDNNTTRFLLISKGSPLLSESGKVSITFSTENKSGALNKVLSILEKYEINIRRILSELSKCLSRMNSVV